MASKKLNIKTNNIDKTPLVEKGVIKLFEKYVKKSEYPIYINFVKRMKNLDIRGDYGFNEKLKRHEIRIRYDLQRVEKVKRLSKSDKCFLLITIIVHEICHLNQCEMDEESFYSKDFNRAVEIKNVEISEYYSDCEREARMFEILCQFDAFELYNKAVKK